MVPQLDAADRRALCAVALVLATVAVVIPFLAVVLGLAWRLLFWAMGAG